RRRGCQATAPRLRPAAAHVDAEDGGRGGHRPHGPPRFPGGERDRHPARREWTLMGDANDAVRFEKWQALGNDYVVVERDALPWELTAERITRICAPHFGVGSDGILLLSRPADGDVVAELRIFNPDGSEAELSGNGAREAALYL